MQVNTGHETGLRGVGLREGEGRESEGEERMRGE